jgi:SAM-dependent methyltransferase
MPGRVAPSTHPGQTAAGVERNISFFRDRHEDYAAHVQTLDTYVTIRQSINAAITGLHCVLDAGNGGVFDYDTCLVRAIVALDLFLQDLPDSYSPPANVTMIKGSVLDIPASPASFDGVIMCMLAHHLVGATVRESLCNVRRAFAEAWRVLRPGGRLIVVESCVPRWFYRLETLVFAVAVPLWERMLPHPATLQYSSDLIGGMLQTETNSPVRTSRIQKGRWILQFGFKVPAVLSPACAYRFTVDKPG